MKVVDAKKLVVNLFQNGWRGTILLLGSPGVGKTEIAKAIAIELASLTRREFFEFGVDSGVNEHSFVYIPINATHVEPADLQGFPKLIGDVIKYVPLEWQVYAHKYPGVLFIDEITNVKRSDVKTALLKLILEKKTGFLTLNKDLLIICAGNDMQSSTLAEELSEPELNRLLILRVENDINDWKEYMVNQYGNDWDSRVFVFLKRYTEYFQMRPTERNRIEYDGFGTPRAWTQLATISHKLDIFDLEPVVKGIVGVEAGTMFLHFLETRVPELEDITMDIWNRLNVEQKYMVIHNLSQRLKSDLKMGNLSPPVKHVLTIIATGERNKEMLALLISLFDRISEQTTKLVDILGFKHEVSRKILELAKTIVRGV